MVQSGDAFNDCQLSNRVDMSGNRYGRHTKVGSRDAPPSMRPLAVRGRPTDTGVVTVLCCFWGTLEALVNPLGTTLEGTTTFVTTTLPVTAVRGLATIIVIFESSTVVVFFFTTNRWSLIGVEGHEPCPRCTVLRMGADDVPIDPATKG